MSYIITRTGSGATPNVCSQVYVKYAGYLLGSTTAFDANNTDGGIPGIGGYDRWMAKGLLFEIRRCHQFSSRLPRIWQPEIRDGNGNTVIPANSYLKFDIELFNVL